tara:strand:- start:3776 stop:4093 length:318 start_codon:yes stop_codon:yes gene_type:complete
MPQTYCFDLDGTLCSTHSDNEYSRAEPFEHRIDEVNKLYDAGHTIIVDTARGSKTGKNWWLITRKQLDLWGLKYHQLRVGRKIAANYYIDDRSIDPDKFFKEITK